MSIPVINSASRAGGNRNSFLTYTITATNSPTSFNAQLHAGGLPAGLSIDTVTGILSGTPTVNGIFSIQLTATNADGNSAPRFLDLHISKPGAPVITSAASATGMSGSAFSYSIVGTNTPIVYGATNLPAGLSVDTGSGVISGTPTTPGATLASITAQNAAGLDHADLSISIAAPVSTAPVITSALAVSGAVGVAFSYLITASHSPTSVAVTNLPPGLSLNASTHIISGAPTIAGLYTCTISATNGSGTGMADVAITISGGSGGGNDDGVPKGLSIFLRKGASIDSSYLVAPQIDMMSIGIQWSVAEPTPGNFVFDSLVTLIHRIATAGPGVAKKILMRFFSGGGSASLGGNCPDHIFTAIGADPLSKEIVPGVTYTYDEKPGDSSTTICFPVFFNTDYVAKKLALYQAAGDFFTNTTQLSDFEKSLIAVIGGAYANAKTDDWGVPNRTAVVAPYVLSEVNRWLHLPGDADPGAGYTSAKMITAGSTLLNGIATAFPGKFVTTAVAQNGTMLDADDGGADPNNYLPLSVATAVNAAFPGRMIVQRNSVTAVQTEKAAATGTAWQIIDQWQNMGHPVAGQALSPVWGDTVDSGGTGYRMNGGSPDDPEHIFPSPMTASEVFRRSGEKLATYLADYYEVYEKDFQSEAIEDLLYVQGLFRTPVTGGITPIIDDDAIQMVEGDAVTYQIVADSAAEITGYGCILLSGSANGLTFSIDKSIGLINFQAIQAGIYVFSIFATNSLPLTGTATLTVTVSAFVPIPQPGTDVAIAFPEISSNAEATKDPCSNLPDIGEPPSTVLNLKVTTPGTASSGTATATWDPPRRQ